MKNVLWLGLIIGLMALASCKQAEGEKAKVKEAQKVEAAEGTSVAINPNNSNIKWEGVKPTGKHWGTIQVSNGEIMIKDGRVTGGNFTIDMNTITVDDLEGDEKAGLEGHLKGQADGKEDHFFNVAKYPTAKFEITKIVSLEGDTEANSTVYGNLTIRDITKGIGFRANIDTNGDAVTVSTPQFTIDRTQWGINYGSKSIFDNLGDKFINDDMSIIIEVNAGKPAM